MKNSFLPKEFNSGHELCFFIHDVLARIIVDGEKENIFKYEFYLEEKVADRINDEDIFTSLANEKLYEDRNKVLKAIVIPALLSDSLHCIYEALNSSKKAKLNITYMLIRKPIQETLYLLESMIIDEVEFGKNMSINPLKLRPSNAGGVEGHTKRIAIVLDKLGLTDIFSDVYISELRYNKKSDDTFDGICNHAMHLFTEHKAIKTDNLNINFIFSNEYSKLTQWAYLYSRLPYLLLYLYYIIEYLLKEICATEKTYLEEIELRIFAHILIWYKDLDSNYYTDELLKLVEISEISLKDFCIKKYNKTLNKSIIKNIAENGISNYGINK